MKTLLVDDHALFREGLALLITQGFPELVLLQAGDIDEALALLERHPDIGLVLLDLELSDVDGTRGLLQMRAAVPQVIVIVLSGDATPEAVLHAIDAGAAGFIPKTSRTVVMEEALRRVLNGGTYVPRELLGRRPPAEPVESREAPATAALVADLTPRQRDVLRLLIEGKTNKLICRELELSESTVKTHLASIFRRLGASSRTQAVVAAARMGVQLGRAVAGS